MSTWTVSEVIQMTDKVAVVFEHPDVPLKVRMLWNAHYNWRQFHYDGTSMRVEDKYHSALIRALRHYFKHNYR